MCLMCDMGWDDDRQRPIKDRAGEILGDLVREQYEDLEGDRFLLINVVGESGQEFAMVVPWDGFVDALLDQCIRDHFHEVGLDYEEELERVAAERKAAADNLPRDEDGMPSHLPENIKETIRRINIGQSNLVKNAAEATGVEVEVVEVNPGTEIITFHLDPDAEDDDNEQGDTA